MNKKIGLTIAFVGAFAAATAFSESAEARWVWQPQPVFVAHAPVMVAPTPVVVHYRVPVRRYYVARRAPRRVWW
jgi:hypothetical protein